MQKVIVLLSDGAANIGQNCRGRGHDTTTGSGRNRHTATTKDPDVHCMQPCQTAVNDANSYTAAGVLVYSILYGDQSNAPYCQDYDGDNESPQITPQTAMENIAGIEQSDRRLDILRGTRPTDLTGIFQQISADMAAGTSRITG